MSGASSGLSRRAFGAALLLSQAAAALGRTPLGGTLRLTLPISTRALDPHAADDLSAALFAPQIADSLFALDGDGRPYPTLAGTLPVETAKGALVTLRPQLTSARGKALDARDAVFSLERARRLGGAAVLRELGSPSLVPKDPLSFVVPGASAAAVAFALASPLTALVSRGHGPEIPDGTGAFRAIPGASRLVLERNVNAARGAAFLERVEISAARDLSAALRAFETGAADVGFLGSGLHRPRPGSVPFEGPELGFLILRTGALAKSWSAPGVAQGLVDRIPAGALRHLGLKDPGGVTRAGTGWGGGPAELFVSGDAPLFAQIADGLLPHLGGSGQITVRPVARSELAERRAKGDYALMLDFVRSAGPRGRSTMLSLLAATSHDLAARPPRAVSFEARDVARTLPLGVVGVLALGGARLPSINGLESFQLGAVSLTA
jgi:peptide/nickel transport system substrate-binding protein